MTAAAPASPFQPSTKMARTAFEAIARGTPPHDALLHRLGQRVLEVPAHAASLWTGPMVRHAWANAIGIRLAEPNLPDVTGEKYVVVDERGKAITVPLPLVRAVRAMAQRRHLDVIEVVGSGRCVVEWATRKVADGGNASRMQAHFLGASIGEIDALVSDAVAGLFHVGDDAQGTVVMRIRVRPQLFQRCKSAAEYDRQLLEPNEPKGKYLSAWVRNLLIDACVKSEADRAMARAAGHLR